MAYFLHHHPHVFAELLARLHDLSHHSHNPVNISSAPSTPLSVSRRRLNRFLFWFSSVSLTKKLAVAAVVVVAPAAVMTGMFMSPQSVSFSFAGNTCFSNPSLFPSVNSQTDGDTFALAQEPSASFGSTPVFSSTTCIKMHSQPETNTTEKLEIKTPLGISKSIEVSVETIPQLLASQQIDPNISQKDTLTFELNTADTNFRYVLMIDGEAIACTTEDMKINCPIDRLELTQGKAYPYTLRRYLGDSYVEIYSGTAQTAEPVTIHPDNVVSDQTVVTHLNTISLTTNKPVTSVENATLKNGEIAIPVTAQIDEKTITITATDNLPRGTNFTLTIPRASAEDGGFLQEPFTLTFSTSGGPRVSSVDIGKTGVSVHSDVAVTMNISLQAGQNTANLASITIGGQPIPTHVSYGGNRIVISPVSNLPKCTEFTVHVAANTVSVHGVGGGIAWSYSARTACYDTFYIGSSAQGRGILAYKFGSGGNTIVFVGGMHGTESSSRRTLDAWVDELDANPSRIPSDKTIVVIPNSNPDGSAAGSRTNARNVDLNRNFPSNDWTADVYQPGNVSLPGGGGTSALSEPESAALASYIQSASPILVLTYHAVARAVIFNGSGNSASLANLYGHNAGFSSYSSSHEDGIFAYPTTGEFETWLHDKLGIPTLLIENATMSGNEIKTQRNAMWAVIGG